MELRQACPLLFFGSAINSLEQSLPVETINILPTPGAPIGLAIPAAEIDGRINIDERTAQACEAIAH